MTARPRVGCRLGCLGCSVPLLAAVMLAVALLQGRSKRLSSFFGKSAQAEAMRP